MLSQELCQRVLQVVCATGADYGELYWEYTLNQNISMINSKVDTVKDTVIAGVGLRGFKGLRCVSASTVDTSEAGLMKCAKQVADALGAGTAEIEICLKPVEIQDIHPVLTDPCAAGNRPKVDILKEAYFAAKDYDPLIA